MKLARIVYKDDHPWRLSDGSAINPPIGTIVQYEESTDPKWYRVYFPGYSAGSFVGKAWFRIYFRALE